MWNERRLFPHSLQEYQVNGLGDYEFVILCGVICLPTLRYHLPSPDPAGGVRGHHHVPGRIAERGSSWSCSSGRRMSSLSQPAAEAWRRAAGQSAWLRIGREEGQLENGWDAAEVPYRGYINTHAQYIHMVCNIYFINYIIIIILLLLVVLLLLVLLLLLLFYLLYVMLYIHIYICI